MIGPRADGRKELVALTEIWNAEDKHARTAAKAFDAAYGAKFPKATAKITDDLDDLLALHATTPPNIGFACVPRTRWLSTFATVRHRTKVTKGPGSRAGGLAMAFKLIEAAQDRWRAVNAPHLIALVRAGAHFETGKLVERPDGQPIDTAA